ncbi:Gfo/Idh/MocA family oxidoreductase [Cryobacterium sp. Sr3]|uniref:Gfo/Idh/MocA family protein n=1 Tax=Cryobacterium sp. Sr3 TaxID=1259194 RepID=UPI00106CBAF4|nr:Gfo/Idh/MocA family oxidoreductase [Cryobacterium sp. Sr3]TFB61013.1 Gfo/Idh/MocA family oxidoreductase [Cryobacterium sp. Sr3]
MSNLRAGLIGLGMMGRHHARVLRELPGVDLVVVADETGDAHNVSGTTPFCMSVAEMLSHNLDMAVVAVPTAFHELIGLQLAEANVHTLMEKPITNTVEEGIRLVEAFESRHLIGAVGHIERFNPALQSMRERIAAGEIGNVYQIVTRRQGPFPARIADVGVIKDLGTHDIDSTAWLAQSNYESIYAQTAHKSGRPHEDLVVATGRLASGVITSHLVNWLSPLKERVTIATGEKGSLVADTITADLTFFENGIAATAWDSIAAFRGVSEGSMIRYALTKREPLRVEHEAFRDAVLGLRQDVVTFRDGLATLRVAEAAIKSSSSGDVTWL